MQCAAQSVKHVCSQKNICIIIFIWPHTFNTTQKAGHCFHVLLYFRLAIHTLSRANNPTIRLPLRLKHQAAIDDTPSDYEAAPWRNGKCHYVLLLDCILEESRCPSIFYLSGATTMWQTTWRKSLVRQTTMAADRTCCVSQSCTILPRRLRTIKINNTRIHSVTITNIQKYSDTFRNT